MKRSDFVQVSRNLDHDKVILAGFDPEMTREKVKFCTNMDHIKDMMSRIDPKTDICQGQTV